MAFADDTTSGMLGHSRAVLLGKLAAQPDDTRGLWLDSDTYPDGVEPILAAMQRPEGVIVWGYPVRLSWDVDYPPLHKRSEAATIRAQPFRIWTVWAKMDGNGYAMRSGDGKLVELVHCGFGAVMMSPAVARAMHGGRVQYDWDGRPISEAFDKLPYPAAVSSEDVSFWRRFQAAGHRIWCDPDVYITNGESGGRFADEIRLREATFPWLCAQAFYAA